MAAEITPEYSQPVSPEHEPAALSVAPNTDPATELTIKERQMIDAFYGFSKKHAAVDIEKPSPADSPVISHAAHDFLHDFAGKHKESVLARHRQAVQEGSATPLYEPELYVMPPAPIERRIKEHYYRFGTRRRTTTDEIRQIEEEYLNQQKRPIYASVYTDPKVDEQGFLTESQKLPRATFFPEIAVGIKLESTLRKLGNITAADSVEVTLAAYGGWFLRRAQNTGIVVVSGAYRDARNIYHPHVEEMPPEVQPEKTRGR